MIEEQEKLLASAMFVLWQSRYCENEGGLTEHNQERNECWPLGESKNKRAQGQRGS